MAKRIPQTNPISIDALDIISYWGKVISAQRKLRGISLRDFAYRAHISLNTLQRIERGEHSVLASNYLNALAVLHVMDRVFKSQDESLLKTREDVLRNLPPKDNEEYF
ncbi:helix-turn-helix domain-containing protein [Methylotenera mobilis]|uniref:Helix-turn-helix domain protein n=1 Tax=Methylotenera mobilis (strain JLW8 / ATCC BAA-1282 / DSM 17540) TaxID=583345 RepID=C6WY92_METML|nr:helix-turn-helix transcriptional regulator [Methylotenera mobilis]ACT46988.1 helix-turn-helix domain protein [Methylotenera mobilis JLW8]